MYARVEEAIPHDTSHDEIKELALYTQFTAAPCKQQHYKTYCQIPQLQVFGIENRNNQYAAYVIYNSQSGKKYLQR